MTSAWNLKIINSLSRAGIIDIDFQPLDVGSIDLFDDPTEREKAIEKKWEDYHNTVCIKIIDQNHQDENYFGDKLTELWNKEERETKQSLDNLQAALEGRSEMGDVLKSLYDDPDNGILVSTRCRGCPGEDNIRHGNII